MYPPRILAAAYRVPLPRSRVCGWCLSSPLNVMAATGACPSRTAPCWGGPGAGSRRCSWTAGRVTFSASTGSRPPSPCPRQGPRPPAMHPARPGAPANAFANAPEAEVPWVLWRCRPPRPGAPGPGRPRPRQLGRPGLYARRDPDFDTVGGSWGLQKAAAIARRSDARTSVEWLQNR